MRISKEIKISLIAIVVFLLAIWGYNFLKGKNIIAPTDEYYVVFERIDGLIESGNVLYMGYKVGNINSIFFDHENSGKFIVKIVLEEKLHIPSGSKAKITQTNLVASARDIELIFNNSDQYLHPGDTLLPGYDKSIVEILNPFLQKIDVILMTMDSVLKSVNSVLSPESQQHLRSGIASLDESLISFKQLLAEDGNLNNSLENLDSVTSNLRLKNKSISRTLDNLSSITTQIDEARPGIILTNLDSTILSLQSIIEKIDNGEGTAGQLIHDSSLYSNLDSTSYYLQLLLKDLQDHPKRYVHFSVFGKKEKQVSE